MQLVAVNPEAIVDDKQKGQRRMTDKGREYRRTVVNQKRASLVSRITRNSSETEDLLYSDQNEIKANK